MDTFKQHIDLEGTPNFRDLGGRPNKNGALIKRGKLFRSGFLTDLSPVDWKHLRDLNLAKICDFRRDDEVERMPTHPPAESAIVRLPVGDGSHHTMIKESLDKKQLTADKVGEFMVHVNQNFVFEHADTYAEFFQQVLTLDNDESLLFHCTAGKDRTGFAAALLLMAMDYDRSDIFSDYMLTKHFFRPEIEMERLLSVLPSDRTFEYPPEIMMPILEVRSEYLQAALTLIDNGPGEESYLRDYIKLSDKDRQHLREKFLA